MIPFDVEQELMNILAREIRREEHMRWIRILCSIPAVQRRTDSPGYEIIPESAMTLCWPGFATIRVEVSA